MNTTITVAGSPVLTMTDTYMIAGCPMVIAGAPAPCLNIQWTAPATGTMVNGVPVLLATSVGLCMGGSPGVAAIVVSGQTQVLGT